MKKAILTEDELVEASDASHDAFITRTERHGVRIEVAPDRVMVKLVTILQPETLPFIFPDPTVAREVLLRQLADWVQAHPAYGPALPTAFGSSGRCDFHL